MITSTLVLFLVPLLSGSAIFVIPKGWKGNYNLVLTFAGAYLLSITITHILPQLFFSSDASLGLTGLFVLVGFFLQKIIEYATTGIEHGHIHTHSHDSVVKHETTGIVLLLAMCLHAFLEAGVLVSPSGSGHHDERYPILIGISLHRAPAAFALMAVLLGRHFSGRRAMIYLLFFSLASPLGLIVGKLLTDGEVLTETGLMILYGIVSGNFLYISTTIVFESSPGHRFDGRKLLVAALGAGFAILFEFFF